MKKTGENTYQTEASGLKISLERGGQRLWHLSASSETAFISCGPFPTRKAAIQYAIETLN